MPKEEWGTKRQCPHCATRFYDLMNDPMTCPECGNVFTAESLTSGRTRSLIAEKTAARDEFMVLYRAGQWPELYAALGDTSWKTIEGWKRSIIRSEGNPLALIDCRGKHLKGSSKVFQSTRP